MSSPLTSLKRLVTRLIDSLTPSAKHISPPKRRVRLAVEALETRDMMSASVLWGAIRQSAAPLTVDSALDINAFNPSTHTGTLRGCINQANFDAARGISDTIIFNPAKMGTTGIMLQEGQLELKAGSGTTTINGGGIILNAHNASRVVLVDPGAHAVLNGLTIEHGNAGRGNGGGVLNNGGILTMEGDIVENNSAVDGGGIYNNGGTLTLEVWHDTNGRFSFTTLSHIDGNAAIFGGGIYNTGVLNVIGTPSDNTDVTLNNNSAVWGGAIFNSGTATVSAATLDSNGAVFAGGAIDNHGLLKVSRSNLNHNVARCGGGIANFGKATVSSSFVEYDHALIGGGIYTPGSLSYVNTTFGGNSALLGPNIYWGW